jgi:hypothetical protein
LGRERERNQCGEQKSLHDSTSNEVALLVRDVCARAPGSAVPNYPASTHLQRLKLSGRRALPTVGVEVGVTRGSAEAPRQALRTP